MVAEGSYQVLRSAAGTGEAVDHERGAVRDIGDGGGERVCYLLRHYWWALSTVAGQTEI
jgi:hypothetical protein